MVILTTKIAQIIQLPIQISDFHNKDIFEIPETYAFIWATYIEHFFYNFWIWSKKVTRRFCFSLYHVNYHPINNEMERTASLTLRCVFWVIKHNNPFQTLEKKLHLEFFTSWQFPDLPIESCEWDSYDRIHFYVMRQDNVLKYWSKHWGPKKAAETIFEYLY